MILYYSCANSVCDLKWRLKPKGELLSIDYSEVHEIKFVRNKYIKQFD